MASAHNCPNCGSPCTALATMLFVCQDPELRQHLPIDVAEIAKAQTQWPMQFSRCPNCGHVELYDPSFDLPEPLG